MKNKITGTCHVTDELKLADVLKNKTMFVLDVTRYTSIPPGILKMLLQSSLPSSNLQILAWVAKLYYCEEPSSLDLDPTGEMIFETFCSLTPQDWYRVAVLLAWHMNLENLMLSSEIQGLVEILMQMLKFLMDMMQKMTPILDHLQNYLTSFEDLKLMANPEFRHVSLVRGKRSTISSRATFVTISRAMCTSGMLSLFGLSNLPSIAESSPVLKDQQTMEDLITKFKIPRDATPFCTSFYLDMVSTTGGAVAWAFLKPMLLGQVLYYPDTPLTRDIINKGTSTLLCRYAKEWLQSSTYLIQSAQVLKKSLPMLKNSLNNPFIQNFIKKQTDIDVTQMQETLTMFSNITELLERNKFIVQQISTLSNLMVNLSSCVNFNRYHGYNSTAELDKQAEMLAQNRELYASIIFKLPQDNSSALPPSLPPRVDYTIRMHIDNSMRTDRVRNLYWFKNSYVSPMFSQRYSHGFVYLQESVERAIIAAQTGTQVQEPAVQVQAFPYPCFYRDDYLVSISFAFPLVLMLAWMLFVANFVMNLVHERELRLHQYMKMMGVKPISHFFAWFIESSIFILFTVIILTVILKAGAVLPKSDSFLIFLYLCDYGLSILAISFLISAFFNKTNIAGLSGSLIYIICRNRRWGNMYVSSVGDDKSSFGWLCWLLLIDSGIYFLLGGYIRMVFPGSYGIPAPWYFPVRPSFWADLLGCSHTSMKKVGRGLLFSNMMQDSQRGGKGQGKGEDEDFSELPVGVSLHGLTKTYGSRNAVENLNLSFYEGHITSLLGHNGAGKTTTMSLLTGLFAPSSGTIEELGVCMQYDVHFDHLTAEEHLLLYGQMKAPQWSKQELHQQRAILEETGMYSHRHKLVGTLSGGMKRKLSISIAFIGGSRLVVLDEPTTGVDPCSRRSIWDVILQHKQDRTIIMSTHHLDEAEVLSDRIAFLERGGLKCCGSPFYLKEKLSCGYNLTLTKKVQPSDSEEKFNIDKVKAYIHSHLPEARLKDREVGDIVYSLPAYNSQNAGAYRSLLTGLDKNLETLQLGCYGISDTTLEEVFLQLTREDLESAGNKACTVSESVHHMTASLDSLPDDLSGSMYFGERTSLTGTYKVMGFALLAQQVMAMLVKRFHHSCRDWKGLVSQILLPVLFVIGAMGLGSIRSNLQYFPEMELSPALYDIGKQYTFFRALYGMVFYLVDTLMSYPGIDHYCMEKPDSEVCQKRGSPVSDEWTSSGNRTSMFESCRCSDFSQTCPKQSYDPPHKTNPSSQIIYNLTNINTEDYLLATANDFIRDRYGGWSFGEALPNDLQMDISDVPKNRTLTKVWYNPEGYHTMPAYLNSLNNFILRANLPADKQPQQYAISLTSHPYPGKLDDEDAMVRGLVSIMVALCILTGYSIMTASFVIYEVQEHHTCSKRLQHISGISEAFYWTINFFYDMALYMVPVLLSVIVIAAFQVPAFNDRLNLGAVTLLLVLFGFASFPWMYLLSSLFKDTEMAFISYVCINLFISLNTIISTAILYFLGQLIHTDERVLTVYHAMSAVFLIFPQFSFGNGLVELARVDMQRQILSAYGVDAYKDPFGMDVLGWMLVSLFLQGFVCFTLRLLLNRWLLQRVRRFFCWRKWEPRTGNCEEDEDVLAECQRVSTGAAVSDLLQVKQLTKVYQHMNRRVPAVQELSFGIPAGECFGLLGVNGAGKTTTFKMLTGEVSPTHGSAHVCAWDGRMVNIMDSRTEGVNIGYCPQVDALDDFMTGEEHLYFYARIKGVTKRETDRVVNYLLNKLELNDHRRVTSEHYSCGTRRKLSTALALIGQPQILLLDEPSSGMDPHSKRHLWKIIAEEVMGKCAVVLTSHSMEECEALCTRLAIMVQGQFRCLGSLQHIKNRFGSGFTVKMYLAGASCEVDAITGFMEEHFPSTYLKDHHLAMVEYHVPVAPGGVADIFDQLESNKATLQIKHFSVCQTTLDEVFINFASGKVDTDSDSPDVRL
uniref:ATP-binding cassette, sub-family A (ABC1), member 12 n=1 Tax=Electrophorus electricus TaxID=8005 RepID=A0A4W4HCX6_ELEEL